MGEEINNFRRPKHHNPYSIWRHIFTADQFQVTTAPSSGGLESGSSFLLHEEMEKEAMHPPPGSRMDYITSIK